jgi:hypothetical protein
MALKLAHEDPTGRENTDAYHRIIACVHDYALSRFLIMVHIYKDQAARNANKVNVNARQFSIDQAAPEFATFFGTTALDALNMNPCKAAYLYLKTLPEYDGAIDC